MRYVAWLNAPRHGVDGHRAQALEVIEMPPCGAAHVIDWLYEVGPMQADGPVTHGELQAWQENTGVDLDAWTARTLRRLSIEYVREHVAAADPARPSPFVPEVTSEESREKVAMQVKNAMAAYFMAKVGKK